MNKREKVFLKTNGRCIYCGSIISYDDFHIDHKNPKSNLKKDFDNIDNLFPSCCDCNLSKGNLSIENFRKKIEQILFNNHTARIITKYYNVKPKKIKFWFEKGDD